MRDAALTALAEGLSRTLSSGLHHARTESSRGYATFNGLAIVGLHRLTVDAAVSTQRSTVR